MDKLKINLSTLTEQMGATRTSTYITGLNVSGNVWLDSTNISNSFSLRNREQTNFPSTISIGNNLVVGGETAGATSGQLWVIGEKYSWNYTTNASFENPWKNLSVGGNVYLYNTSKLRLNVGFTNFTSYDTAPSATPDINIGGTI